MKTYLLRLFLVLVMHFIFFSCVESKKECQEQFFPQSMIFNKDSLYQIMPDRVMKLYSENDSAQYYFVNYYDSLQCTQCEMKKLALWNSIIRRSSERGIRIKYFFIFSPSLNDTITLKRVFKESRFMYPIYLDTLGIVKGRNPFITKDIKCHHFVIDKTGVIVYVGNPVINMEAECKFEDFIYNIQ